MKIYLVTKGSLECETYEVLGATIDAHKAEISRDALLSKYPDVRVEEYCDMNDICSGSDFIWFVSFSNEDPDGFAMLSNNEYSAMKVGKVFKFEDDCEISFKTYVAASNKEDAIKKAHKLIKEAIEKGEVQNEPQ